MNRASFRSELNVTPLRCGLCIFCDVMGDRRGSFAPLYTCCARKINDIFKITRFPGRDRVRSV